MAQTNLATGFNGVQFDVISRSGAPWLRVPQIEVALGYSKRGAIQMLYDRHADEFTDSMTAVVTLPTPGGPQETRIFSLRGCHLLAMFARTPVAKAFRVWVLDVLETLGKAEKETPALTDAPITPDQQCTLQALVRALVEKGGIYAAIWSRFNNHFRLGSYKQLPQSRMSEAVDYLARFDAQTKALPEPEARSKQKALPSTHDPLREKIGQELSKVDFYIKEIAAAEDRVFQLLLEKWRNEHPGEIAHEDRVLVASGCATRHLWSSINASLEALRASVTARLGVGA